MWAMPATLLSSSLPFLIFHRFSSPALEFFLVLPYKNNVFSLFSFFSSFWASPTARQPAQVAARRAGGIAQNEEKKEKKEKHYFCKVKRGKIQRHGRKMEGKTKRQGKKIRMHPMWAMPATLLSSSLPFLIFHRFSSPALEFFLVLPYKNNVFSLFSFFSSFWASPTARQPAQVAARRAGGIAQNEEKKEKKEKHYFCKVKRGKIQRHGRKMEGKTKRQGKKIRIHPRWASHPHAITWT